VGRVIIDAELNRLRSSASRAGIVLVLGFIYNSFSKRSKNGCEVAGREVVECSEFWPD
jgi:hypothetical protein